MEKHRGFVHARAGRRRPDPRSAQGLAQSVSRAGIEGGADTAGAGAGAGGGGPMALVGLEYGDTEREPVRARLR